MTNEIVFSRIQVANSDCEWRQDEEGESSDDSDKHMTAEEMGWSFFISPFSFMLLPSISLFWRQTDRQ